MHDNNVRWPNNASPPTVWRVLKARGELVAAEAQYRDNIVRWPSVSLRRQRPGGPQARAAVAAGYVTATISRWSNDGRAANGLARCAPGTRADYAGAQYQSNIAHWPAFAEVAASGLARMCSGTGDWSPRNNTT
ncbi:hypothetical protein [endosymbiont of Lamellibrachia barhami]|uniref:hypothetical protein n=1 Tax=endosymbiont of Lamellibrachia barhami TaxID=205975 RepID=UPI0015A7860D|nr:hypothetical protein [endosymbiont of Lamellibrachia barhami]